MTQDEEALRLQAERERERQLTRPEYSCQKCQPGWNILKNVNLFCLSLKLEDTHTNMERMIEDMIVMCNSIGRGRGHAGTEGKRGKGTRWDKVCQCSSRIY